jgi:hypothetical protein
MKGRQGLLIVFGMFAAPFVLAAIVYQMGWFNAGVTNKGEFLDKEVTLSWILPKDATDTEWKILYHIPTNCDLTCTNVLFSLHQGFQALGKLQEKATPVAIRTVDASISTEQLKEGYGYIHILEQQSKQEATLNQLSSDYVYLVDPFGKVILRYKATAKKHDMIMTTKDWISDLKRLLKFSRTS